MLKQAREIVMEKKELGKVKLIPYYRVKWSGMYRWDFQGFEECDQFHRAAVNEQGEVLFVAEYKDASYKEVKSIFVVDTMDNGTLRLHSDNFNWDFIVLDRGGCAKAIQEEISNEIESLKKRRKEISELSWE